MINPEVLSKEPYNLEYLDDKKWEIWIKAWILKAKKGDELKEIIDSLKKLLKHKNPNLSDNQLNNIVEQRFKNYKNDQDNIIKK